jgi:hypothetical protein
MRRMTWARFLRSSGRLITRMRRPEERKLQMASDISIVDTVYI